MSTLRHHLSFALRSLARSPVFTLVALLTLALGIGANTAIFTVVKAVLLAPLPYPEPERVVFVQESNVERGLPRFSIAPPNFRDYRDQNQVFEAMAAYSGTSLALTGDGAPERLRARRVTGDYFKVLDVGAIHGRVLDPEDDRPGAPKVAVIAEAFWQRRFGGELEVLGQTLRLDGEPVEVVGIVPDRFHVDHDLYVPLALDYAEANRGGHYLGAYARLAEGVSLERAREDLAAVAAVLEETYPETNKGWSTLVDPLLDRMVDHVRPALWLLTLAVGLVLLIACVNVANLMLSRMALRGRELALRSALGAGRFELIRQMLVESVLIALGGGMLGFLLAIFGTRALVAWSADGIPRAESIAVDGNVLAFTLVLSILTGLVFGLLPALRASRPDLQDALREGGRGQAGGRGGEGLRAGLVLAEVAVAVVLLVGAGLLIKSFAKLLDVDPGFDAEKVLTVRMALPESKYPEQEDQIAFYRELFERVEAVPGVSSGGAVFPMPLTGSGFSLQFFIEGRPRPPLNQEPGSNIRAAAPGYFETVEIPVREGRTFTFADGPEVENVVVLNESAARQWWPDSSPIGERITFNDLDAPEITWYRVIGVVGDVHHESLAAETEPEIYWSYLQNPLDIVVLVLRTAGDPESVVGPLRSELTRLDPELPLYDILSLRQIVDESVAQPRFNSLLLGLFAALAVILSAIGVYGLISYAVTQRLRELGVRLALGAERREILGLVFRQGMAPVVLGAAVGLLTAFGATRLLESLVYGVATTDLATYAAVILLLLAVAALACLLPAWRATRIDPMEVLREE